MTETISENYLYRKYLYWKNKKGSYLRIFKGFSRDNESI